MLAVPHRVLALSLLMIGVVCLCRAQESNSAQKPQVKVNVLNVCSPAQAEQGEISAALERIPRRPAFGPDFEVDRGRSVFDPNTNPLTTTGNAAETTQAALGKNSPKQATAQFVRIRHDFESGQPFSNVQYSFSRDSEDMVETLVFRLRDPKDLLEISIESSASAVTSAAAMLTTSTPAGRVKLERFGKSSVVLARCSGQNGSAAVDQGAYEPLFSSASSILADYRRLLDARKLIPEELARMGTGVVHRQPTSAAHHP